MADAVDQEIRDHIIHNFTRNILVEAGAGTGKTTLMVDRAVEAIVEQGVSLERMALITFMEKAANEMKIRVRMRLEDLLESNFLDERQRRRVQQALHDLPVSAITTIHGFAKRFLESQGHHAPVPLGFKVMDVYEYEQLFEQTFYQWVKEDTLAANRIEALLNDGLPFERFQQMTQFLSAQDDIPVYQAQKPTTDFVGDMKFQADELVEVATRYAQEMDPGLLQIRDIARFLQTLVDLEPAWRVKALGAWQVTAGKGNKKNWHDGTRLAEQKAFIAALKEQVETFREQLADYLLSEILDLIGSRFLPYWKARRWALGRLSFDDLLWETRDFLRRQGSDGRYDIIMVDEFQDTDALQAEIIVRMLATPKVPVVGEWLGTPIPQGKLFVVGDPKQSIYRFRGADVVIYQQMRQKIVEDGGVALSIVQNFRTPAEILEPVNQLFAAHWPHTFDPQQPYVSPYTPLTPFFHAGNGPRLIVDGGEVGGGAYARRLFEARLIARYLRKMVIETPCEVQDGHEGRRPIRFGDVALLIPNRSGLHVYQQILQQEGITVAPEGGIRFFERDEIRGFQQFLSALRYPDEELYTVAWLLSPWVGFSLRDLAEHKAQGGNFQYFIRGDCQKGGSSPILEALARLKAWHQKWWHWRAEDLFWDLYEWSALPQVLSEREDVASLSNLVKMADLCRDLGDDWGNDGFCRWLERKVKNQEREEEGSLPQTQDAVHIVTVHKSKGLEWPLVVVANWNSRPSSQHSGLRIGSHRIAMAVGDLRSRLWEELAEEDHRREQAEIERLYYVALTRARDYLVVVETFDPGQRTQLSSLSFSQEVN